MHIGRANYDDQPHFQAEFAAAMRILALALQSEVVEAVVLDDHARFLVDQITSSNEPAESVEDLDLRSGGGNTGLDDDGPGDRFAR